MPTIFRIGNTRVVIHTNDHPPPHVHVVAGRSKAIVLIEREPRIRRSKGFSKPEMRAVLRQLSEKFEFLMDQWDSIHGRQSSN